MDKLKEYIDLQIESNQSKNLFYKDFLKIMKFTQSTFDAIQKINEITEEDLNLLIDYTTEKVLQELYLINQYYTFLENDIVCLKNIYWNLYQNIKRKEIPLESIEKVHYNNLKNWLEKSNDLSNTVYRQNGAVLEAVACSEYSFELQKSILCLDKIQLLEPILDIGCGKNGNLVKSLIENNFDAHGIDRVSNNLPYLEKMDWLKYDYGNKKWGTIVSNLGFSNHFIHNHLRKDGNIIEYAKKYIDILKSLKINGCFCYAPDLPFIEKYLDKKAFSVSKYSINGMSWNTTIIKQLS